MAASRAGSGRHQSIETSRDAVVGINGIAGVIQDWELLWANAKCAAALAMTAG
jgi:hypothetical protein